MQLHKFLRPSLCTCTIDYLPRAAAGVAPGFVKLNLYDIFMTFMLQLCYIYVTPEMLHLCYIFVTIDRAGWAGKFYHSPAAKSSTFFLHFAQIFILPFCAFAQRKIFVHLHKFFQFFSTLCQKEKKFLCNL